MTGKPVIPRALANRDVQETIDHYLVEGAAKAASGFIGALERTYARIGRHPGSGAPRCAHELNLPGLRCRALPRYPYLVFYVEREDWIDVWCVLHGRRDVPAWMEGL